MNDIALRAGVHQTTVSRALRNDPHLPVGTRERIQRIAGEMGYRPNPLVSALVAFRRLRKPPVAVSSLGFIVRDVPMRTACRRYLEGARSSAMQLGYKVEVFRLTDGPGNEARLGRVLHTRGIQGLILGPLPEPSGGFSLKWEHFSTVALEHTFSRPLFDRVVHDNYGGMRLLMERCRVRGIRRVGLVLSKTGHERTQRSIAAAFLVEQQLDDHFTAIPPLLLDTWEPAAFARWNALHQPEVIIGSNDILGQVEAWHRWMPAGDRPQLLNVNVCGETPLPGIEQAAEDVGAVATRLLVDKVQRNARGVPAQPQTVLIPGRWADDERASQLFASGSRGTAAGGSGGSDFGEVNSKSSPSPKSATLVSTNQSPCRT